MLIFEKCQSSYVVFLFALFTLIGMGSGYAFLTTVQYDVDKYWEGNIPPGVDPYDTSDSYMCWAATASNILKYTRWGYIDYDGDTTSGELYEDIYHEFLQVFHNSGGSGSLAFETYFDWHYPTLTWTDYFLQEYDTSLMMDSLKDWLEDDYGIYLSVGTGTLGMGHAITAWGYTAVYTAGGQFIGYDLAITDSDDEDDEDYGDLQTYRVILDNNKWYLQNFYDSDNRFIRRIDALKKRAFTFQIIGGLPIYTYFVNPTVFTPIPRLNYIPMMAQYDDPVIPEPSSLLLLSFGLLGAGLFKRKITKK